MIFNWVFPSDNWELLGALLMGLLGLYLLRNVLYFYSKYSTVSVGEDLSFTLRKHLFERLQQMKLQYYRDNKPGQLSSRVMNDSFVVQQFMQDQVPKLLQSSLLFLGVGTAMYVMNWQLALASTIVLPLHLLTFRYFHGPIKRASRSASESTADATGNLIEKFLGIEVVKSFTAEARENEAFQQAIDRSRQNQLRGQKFQVGQKVMADLLIGIGMIGLLGFGAYQVMAEGMPHGNLVAFFWYVKMLYPTVTELMNSIARVPRAGASVDRIAEVLDSEGDERNDEPALRPDLKGRLTFENIWFRYAADDHWVLEDIHVTIEPGEVCAIVGPSGSGKSTLVHTVPRFIDPTHGRLLVDGFDARLIDLTYLRQQIGFAFQECFLFNSTILENLRYAWPEASLSTIEDVAMRTGAHNFIEKLPQGYDTIVGEKGVSLSRGQKQLITLTRAMLKNPRILVLDEATASVDEQHEAQVVANIRQFMQGKTTLIITHRPELLQHADRVIELREGRMIASGPPTARPNGDQPARPTPPPGWPRGSKQSSGPWPAVTPLLLACVLLGSLFGPSDHSALAQTTQPKQTATQPAATAQPAQPATGAQAHPLSKAGRLVPLPNADRSTAREMVRLLAARAQAMGYRIVRNQSFAALPRGPESLEQRTHLHKPTPGGVRLLQLGYQPFTSQPDQLWLYAVLRTDKGVKVNPDLALLEKRLQELQANNKQQDGQAQPIDVASLRSRKLTLSYTSVDRCVKVLSSLGYNVVRAGEGKTPAAAKVKPANLPLILAMPAVENNATGLVGNKKYTVGGEGGARNIAQLNDTVGVATTQLLVFYQPNQPEQYAELRGVVRQSVDVPARQIMIEAMVLELSESTLDKLGVEWKLQPPLNNDLDNISNLRFGQIPNFTGGEAPTFDISIEGISNHWRAQLQALVRENRARVLSRPSVLTLNNRQAFIRVGEDIPIATSAKGTGRGDLISFNFEYIPVGISLNVRPRVSAQGEQISMQINGDVSATVPGEDLVIRDNEGDVAASAPRLSQRRVQTYARVANNTPFIIGGLISEDKTREENKVPLLGDIPVAGALFRNTEIDTLKREVIIVLTPYVLPKNQVVGRNLPKDEDAFDSFGNELFRDAYRIRAEDVFDLSFLTENEHVQRMQDLTERVVGRNYDLRDEYPFSKFVDGRIPGERILVYRQMYEVVKRKDLSDKLKTDKIIFFEKNQQAQSNFSVAFIEPWLRELAEARDWPEARTPIQSVKQAGKAIALIYTDRRRSNRADDILRQPVPEVRVIDCPSDAVWSEKLWQLNQPNEQGQDRFTILLRDQADLNRLKRALVLKRTVQLNGQRKSLTLDNFSIGRQLLLPAVKPEKVHLIDADAANYFFLTEQYYPALQKNLRQASEALRQELRNRQVPIPER
jgi:subfamily B ATP-binding cassette protein MsbA